MGWHGSFPRGFRLAGLGSIVVLIGFLSTTRDFDLGATAVLWLAGIALLIALGLVRSLRRRRPY